MKSHRVLLLNESSSDSEVEGRTLKLAKALPSRSIPTLILGSPNSPLARRSRAHRVPFRACTPVGGQEMKQVFKVWRRIQHFRPTVVHTVTHRDLLTASLALHLAGQHLPELVAEVGPENTSHLPPPVRWAFRQCQGLLLNTPSHRAAFTAQLVDLPGRLLSVRLGLHPAPLSPHPFPLRAPLKIGLFGLQADEDRDILRQFLGGPSKNELALLPLSLPPGLIEVPTEGESTSPHFGELFEHFDICVLATLGGEPQASYLPLLATPIPVLADRSPKSLKLLQDDASLYPNGDLRALAKLIESVRREPSPWFARALERAARIRQEHAEELLLRAYLSAYGAVS